MSTEWLLLAACREEEPELFFPIGNTTPALLQTEEAKDVCRRCPVMEQCRRWALETAEEYGIWGGLSENERSAARRRAARRSRRNSGRHTPA
ncbi:WhiB family transcriptional regulator [Streptomyces sp. NPDC057654]|uniref:WhiB family transcriptional regulator n=1 Tax=Streptomyces sp. NPDC057654 TaxID=3346196 RepID=UPI0036A765AF